MRVKARCRLVEEHDRGIPHEAHRDVEPAAHAPRVRADAPASGLGEPKPREQAVCDADTVRDVTQLSHEQQVLAASEDVVNRRELAREADSRANVGRVCRDVEPANGSGPSVGPKQGGEDLDERRLASPIGPEQGEDAAVRDLEVHAAEHGDVTEGLLEPAHLHGTHGVACSSTALSMEPTSRARSLAT